MSGLFMDESHRLMGELNREQQKLKRLRHLLERVQQLLVEHQYADDQTCPECGAKQGDDHFSGCEWFSLMVAKK